MSESALTPKKMLIIGESLLEFCQAEDGRFVLDYGGDVLTAGLYLSRLQEHTKLSIDFLTVVGNEPFSHKMVEYWKSEKIGVDLVTYAKGKAPGSYIMRPDAEHPDYCYYRGNMASRDLFQVKENIVLADSIDRYDYLYLSINTVNMLTHLDQETLLDLLHAANQKNLRIFLSCYYYPQIGSALVPIRNLIQRIWVHTDICFVDFDNQQTFFPDENPADAVQRLCEWGIREPLVTQNHHGYCYWDGKYRHQISLPKPENIIDLTGGHYGFEAGYIAARLMGKSRVDAIRAGHQLSHSVMEHKGGILPANKMPKLFG